MTATPAARPLTPPAMIVPYHLLRTNDEDGEDHDRVEVACPCGATIVVTAGEPGPGFAWRVTHGAGEAALTIAGMSDAHLLWLLGLKDPLAAWVEAVHIYESEAA